MMKICENLIHTWCLRPGVGWGIPVMFPLALCLWKWPSCDAAGLLPSAEVWVASYYYNNF